MIDYGHSSRQNQPGQIDDTQRNVVGGILPNPTYGIQRRFRGSVISTNKFLSGLMRQTKRRKKRRR